MKPTSLEGVGSHAEAILRGWVKPAGTEVSIEFPAVDMANDSGVDLLEGQAVVVLSDGSIARASSVSEERPTGICIDDIEDGDSGPVCFLGPVDLIRVTTAVTAGQYGRTSASAGSLEPMDDPAGAVVYFTSDGTEPEGFVLAPAAGSPADSSTGSSGSGMVPYFIASDETFTVPLYKQALFTMTIDNEGILEVDGFLLEVA